MKIEPRSITHLPDVKLSVEATPDEPAMLPCSRRSANTKLTLDEAKEKIAFTVPKLIRSAAAAKAQKYMFENGTRWNGTHRSVGQTTMHAESLAQKAKSLDRLSNSNINRLFSELRVNAAGERVALSPKERDFFNTFVGKKFYATHFTPRDVKSTNGIPSLRSLVNLSQGTKSSPSKESTAGDLAELGNGDYVFLALECGDLPKKQSSRFGSRRLRYDFDQPQFSNAWASLNDFFGFASETIERRLPGLEEGDYRKVRDTVQSYANENFFFSKSQIKDGIALSAIHLARALSETGQDRVLSARSDDEMNHVMNGLFRPEVKVPRFLVTRNVTETDGHDIYGGTL